VLSQKHTVAIAHTHMTWERLREAGLNGRDKFRGGLGSAVRKVQDVTGLKVQEALGRGTTTASKVVEKAKEASQSVGDAAAKTTQSSEKPSEEKGEETRRRV